MIYSYLNFLLYTVHKICYNIGMKTNKTIVGIYDKKAQDLVFAQVYSNYEVACREIFRQVWREDFKAGNYVDDYIIVDVLAQDDDKSCTLLELAKRYGVM